MKQITAPHPRKRPTQARALARVDLILDATAVLLERSGYDALTTNAIAREANVNVASLYQYFPNKQAVVAALAERHASIYLTAFEGIEVALAEEEDWRAVFDSYIGKFVLVDVKLPGALAVRAAMASDPILREIDARNDSDIAALIAKGLKLRGLSARRALLVARTMVGAARYLFDIPLEPNSKEIRAMTGEYLRMQSAYLATYLDD